jgi:hypothetical protein
MCLQRNPELFVIAQSERFSLSVCCGTGLNLCASPLLFAAAKACLPQAGFSLCAFGAPSFALFSKGWGRYNSLPCLSSCHSEEPRDEEFAFVFVREAWGFAGFY